jgi:tetratricopeptide (TPR) repeat protein
MSMEGRQRKISPALWLPARSVLVLAAALGACQGEPRPPATGVAGPGALEVNVESAAKDSSPLGDYLAGNFALESGDIVEAAGFFERALADDPDNLELRRQVFLLDLASGRYDAALAEARQLAEQDPGDEDVRLLLALDHARAGRYGEVETALGGLSDKGIVGLAAPFVEAWSIFAQGGAEAAERTLARLRSGESLGPLNRYHEAMVLALSDRADEALKAMDEAWTQSGPAPVRLVQARAHMLAAQGRAAEALAFARAQVDGRDDQPVLGELLAELEAGRVPAAPFADAIGGMADALLGIAEALQQERGIARAVMYARLAQFVRPDLAGAALLIGDVLADEGNYDGAIENYRTVATGSPLGYVAQLRVATALHELKRSEDAYSLLQEIAAAEPERTDALIELGNLLRRDEDYARAETAYSRAIERLAVVEPEHWTLFYARGIAYERTKRWPQAEADFLRALELEPEQPFVLNYLGYSWVDKGQNLDQAKDMLRRAVELRPNDGFIVDSMGWVHYRLGDYEQAVDELERAVELEPGDPVINDHLGDAYWKVGREREAVFQWQRALTLEPDDEVLAAIRQKLKDGLPADPS